MRFNIVISENIRAPMINCPEKIDGILIPCEVMPAQPVDATPYNQLI
jgi:hypothetical protein